MVPKQHKQSGFRWSEGWWVAAAAMVACVVLILWALAPAALRMFDRPPGDGHTVASYAFDLSNPSINPDLISTSMLHRDMVPVLDAPHVLTMADVDERNDSRTTRYLVSDDLVIGVVHDGVARAYPLSVMHVHELVHDVLGTTPILVSWHWPSGASRVLIRDHQNDQWGISGLAAGGNALLYKRSEVQGGESLHSQWLAETITGPNAGTPIRTIPHRVCRWSEWKQEYPESTVAGPDPSLKKRYRKSDPSTYYENNKMLFDLPVPEGSPPAKSWMTCVATPEGEVVRSWTDLHSRAVDGVVEDNGLRFMIHRDPDTVVVLDSSTGTLADARHSLWFSFHALRPDGFSH
ncbi:MAG: DUF3179 domain-containing (seleno)protein [Phycisphaerales bacterium]|nr:DUF3179 domain-containing (seleno)protein [Phycisphaerales bacterium]